MLLFGTDMFHVVDVADMFHVVHIADQDHIESGP